MAWVVIIIVVVLSIAFIAIANQNKLKSEYQTSLKGTNKERALKAGRAYYSSLRSGKLTIYDEQAIANDLNAMKSGPAKIESAPNASTLIEQLEKLGELKAKGILTEDEFNQQKAKLLGK